MTSPQPDLGRLAVYADLAEFPDPVADGDVLQAACTDVRGECGWHIAPHVVAHTVAVSGTGRTLLVLPSLRITAVHSVIDVTTGAELDGWRTAGVGQLVRDGASWPRGEHNIQVVLDHGFDQCPADLIAVVAHRARTLAAPTPDGVRARTRTVGGVTTTTSYQDAPAAWPPAAAAVLDRYRV